MFYYISAAGFSSCMDLFCAVLHCAVASNKKRIGAKIQQPTCFLSNVNEDATVTLAGV